MSRAEPRSKTYLVGEIRNHVAFMPEKGTVGPLVAEVQYLGDLPGGCLLAIDDPNTGRHIYEIKIIERKNMAWEKPLPSSATLDDQGDYK